MGLRREERAFGAVSVCYTRDCRFRVECGPDVMPMFHSKGRWLVSVVDADAVMGELLQALVKAEGPNGPPAFGVVMQSTLRPGSSDLASVFIYPTDCGFYVDAPMNPRGTRVEVDPMDAVTSALRLLEECRGIQDAFFEDCPAEPEGGPYVSPR